MEVQSIRCGLPFMSQGEQTQGSRIARITALVLGCLVLTVGIGILNGDLPGLNSFGTVGGSFLIALGSLSMLMAFFIACVKGQQTNAPKPIVDTKGTFFSSETEYDSKTGEEVSIVKSYTGSKSFLASIRNKPIIESLKKSVECEDLYQRLVENFGTEDVNVSLPIISRDGINDEAYPLNFLILMFSTKEKLLTTQTYTIEGYTLDMLDMLCLRLQKMGPLSEDNYTEGSLGAFIKASNEDVSYLEDTHSNLYPCLTNNQLGYLLSEYDLDETEIDADIAKDLFPCDGNCCFLTEHSKSRLSTLPKKYVDKLLPFLKSELIAHLIEAGRIELDYTLVTKDQLSDMFPSTVSTEDKSRKKIEKLSVKILNQFLPNMGDAQLQLISDNHLRNGNLNLQQLFTPKIKGMFPLSFSSEDKSRARIKKLHSNNFNYVKKVLKLKKV